MEAILVYVTIGTMLEAEVLCKQMVQDKLVACANVFPMHAIYAWKGEVMSEKECSIIFKTQIDLWDKVRNRILELHPYDCPAILSLPVNAVHQPYLQWLFEATTSPLQSQGPRLGSR